MSSHVLTNWPAEQVEKIPAAREAMLPYLSKGAKGAWKWEDALRDAFKALGLDFGDRTKECLRYAASWCRKFYPTREDVWAATTWDVPTVTRLLAGSVLEAKYRVLHCEPEVEKVVERDPNAPPKAPKAKTGKAKAESNGEAPPPPPKPEMPAAVAPPPPPAPVA